MLRRLQPISSSVIFATPARSLFRPHPAAIFSNPGVLSQVAFKASTARDPERPKLPAPAYLRFAADYRSKHNLKGGKESMTQIGAAWKNASLVDKAPFEKEYAQEKDVYEKAFQEYKDSGKLDAWKRDPAAPKRPLGPYFEWSVEKKKEPKFANMSVTEAAKALKPEWDAMPAAQKEALKSKYAAEMQIYKKQKEIYDASAEKAAWMEKTGRLKTKQEAEAKKAKELAKKEEAKAKAQAKKEAAKLKAAKKKEQEAAKKAKAAEKKAAKKAKEAEKKAAEKEKMRKKKESEKLKKEK